MRAIFPRVNNVNYTVNYNFFLEHVFAIGSRAYFQQPKCNALRALQLSTPISEHRDMK